MNTHKNDLSSLSTRRCWRGGVGWWPGSARRSCCWPGRWWSRPGGAARLGCRCAEGEPHGPYVYFAPKTAGRGRLRYVPAALIEVVRRCVHTGAEVEAVLAEISAINAELLARRELR